MRNGNIGLTKPYENAWLQEAGLAVTTTKCNATIDIMTVNGQP